MLLLMEVTYSNGKESQSLYHNYANETALLGDFETKLGQAMKAEAFKAELLIAFDHTGKILNHAYTQKEDVTLSPRLVWITSDSEGEHENLQKYSDMNETMANYHIRRGASMKGTDLAIMTMAIDGTSVASVDYWVRQDEAEA